MVTTTEQQREAFARLCLVTAEKHREEAAQLTFAALISPLEEREAPRPHRRPSPRLRRPLGADGSRRCPVVNRRPTCSPRHRRFCSPAHSALVGGYRDARDARDALRESGEVAPPSFGSVAFYQLEDADFDAAVPKVLFKEWLMSHARSA